MSIIVYNSGSTLGVGSISGGSATVTNSWTHTSTSGKNQIGIAVGSMTSGAAGSGTDVTATWGGVSMTKLATLTWGTSGNSALSVFVIKNPASGAQTVTVTHSNLAFSLAVRQFTTAALVYNNAYDAAYNFYSNPTTTTTTSAVSAVGSVIGDFSLFAHARGDSTAFLSYDKTQRVTDAATSFNRLLVGDTTNTTGTVTSTATTSVADSVGAVSVTISRNAISDFFFS